MEWLMDNLLWIVLGAVFIWMHLKMHSGHHGHGGHGRPDHEGDAGHGGHKHAGCCGGGHGSHRTPDARSEPPERRHADTHGPRT